MYFGFRDSGLFANFAALAAGAAPCKTMENLANKPAPRAEEKGLLGKLFWSFLRIGAFTFGGGWAMISLIEREVVDNRQWIGREEFLDLLAVAQSLPGILAVNIAVAVGDRLRGMRGSVCAALGNILPSFLIILTVAVFLTPDLIKNNPVVAAIFQGIRPAVVALIVAPMVTSAKAAKIGWKTVWIPIVVALLIWSKWPVVSNPILYIVLGGLLGWVVLSHVEQRRAKTGGAENDDEL